MSYEVTAARKRPSAFDSLAGQEFVVATLKNAIRSVRIAHAYLFSGPRGVGKTSAARILAKSLNCVKGPTAEPCGICANCTEISRGNSLDVIEIDGASNTSVNDVRQIKDEVLFAPNGSRYKVYIIDEVHMLSNSAFNALLKTIEEPPPYIIFIFATTEIQKVPATIRSRCQQFNFRSITLDIIRDLLKNLCAEMSITAEDDALLWIAKEAGGSLRDAYTIFDQVVSFSENEITLQKIRDKHGFTGLDRMNEFCEFLAEGKTKESFLFLDDLFASGVSAEQFVLDAAEYFRNILWIKAGIRKESILGYSAERFSSAVVGAFHIRQVEKAQSLLFELYRNLRYSLNQRFEIELAVARLADLKNYVSPEQIAERLSALRKELKTGFVIQNSGALPQTEALPEGDGPGEDAGAENFPPEQAGAEDGDVPGDKRTAIIQNLQKTKRALSSNLETATRWQIAGDSLYIYFDTKFAADFIRGDLSSVTEQVHKILGPELKILVKVNKEQGNEENGERKDQDEDERVEIVTTVFHGEVVK
jgi:DNA polymerase-3 subunit gamma/tau